MRGNEAEALKIGTTAGIDDLLVRFFDLIQSRQRERWNCPDWRDAPITDADLVNWRDVSFALYHVAE